MEFSGRFLLNLIHFAVNQGAPLLPLVQSTGYTEEELNKDEVRVESTVYNKLIASCLELTGDNYFGLHAGEYLNLSAAGLIAQITQTSSTVKEALMYCCEFANLGCRALPMKLISIGELYQIRFVPDPLWEKQSPVATKQTIDGTLAFTLRQFHALTRQKHYPKQIHFTFKQPMDIEAYQRIFKCPIIFNQETTAIFFEKKHIELPVITNDFNLLRILVGHAHERLAAISHETGFYNVVKKSVVNLVKPEFPTIEQVADNLNTSVRTLQRKLGEEGYTFKQILDEIRKEFALSYVRQPDLSISEIAYLLNYADASTFIRSFKRWTHKTPQLFRESLWS